MEVIYSEPNSTCIYKLIPAVDVNIVTKVDFVKKVHFNLQFNFPCYFYILKYISLSKSLTHEFKIVMVR